MAIDIRRGLSDLGLSMIDLCLGFNIKANIIITKSDKVSRNEKIKIKIDIQDELNDYHNISNICTFSAKNGDGVSDILEILKIQISTTNAHLPILSIP